MRLVTYERRHARRLGALVGEAVVDLPDAVGHPAFPPTLEALVAHNGGSMLAAARRALGNPDYVRACIVKAAKLLVPLIPSSLREFVAEPASPAGSNGQRRVLGPGQDVAWPPDARYLGCELEVACVVGRSGRALSPRQAQGIIFGFTLMADWSAWSRHGNGDGGRRARVPTEFATAIGPCVVTSDEFDPSGVRLTARIGDEVWSEGVLEPVGPSFPEIIAEVSRREEVVPGEVYGSAAFGFGYRIDPGKALRPGTTVELEAEGIGVLRNRVRQAGRRNQSPPRAPG